MKTKYQYTAGLQESTGEIIYSRAVHDCHSTTDGQAYVYGGSDYFRSGWDSSKGLPLKQIVIELDIGPDIMYDDWNYRRNQYGIIKPISVLDSNPPKYIYTDKVRIVPKEEYEDKTTFEYKKKYATWGTYGPKGDQPRRTVMLQNADVNHLKSILSTQIHIGKETAEIIKSILKDRGIEC